MYFSGGDHIETRAVRQYINNLETSLKSAKFDGRSSERPYSSLSWRGNDLANLEKKSRITSAKSSSRGHSSRPGSLVSRIGSHRSRPGSQTISRPVSGQADRLASHRSSLSHLSASERIVVDASKPSRLLQRESVDRKLKQKGAVSPVQVSPTAKDSVTQESRKQISIEISTGEMEEPQDGKVAGVLLDSFGHEGDKSAVKFRTSPVDGVTSEGVVIGRETPPQRLYRRFGSPHGSEPMKASHEGAVMRVGEMTFVRNSESSAPSRKDSPVKHKRPTGSARSIGSSLYTTVSGTSVGSTKSHKSTCDIPAGPHSIHVSNVRTITVGPHSSIRSLMGYQGPKDISKGIHHKSAWYHVPGRYSTVERKMAPKRSQKRQEAKDLLKRIPRTEPDPYSSFMKSDYRKNNPHNVRHCGHISSDEINYPPYPKDNRKQYIICDKCQTEADEIIAAHERELLGLVDGSLDNLQLEPTVNPITTPDRPKQLTCMVDEPLNQEEMEFVRTHTTVKFQDPVIVNWLRQR